MNILFDFKLIPQNGIYTQHFKGDFYLILYFIYPIEVCLFPNERQNVVGLGWKGRWEVLREIKRGETISSGRKK